jgi:hypothetical protein
MKNIILVICAFGLFSCGKIEELHDAATKVIPAKMESLSQNTSELKRIETVKTAIQELNDPKNYKKLSPVPVDILAWAKKAAENMLVDDELIPYIYTKISDIESIRYDDNNLGKPYDMNDPACVQFEMNKVGVFNAIAAISAFLPEDKVDRLVERLQNSDEYSPTVLNILALRAYFINNVLMNEKYKQNKLVDLGSVEAAISYNQKLERVLRLSFVADVKVDITGFVLLADYNQALSVRPDMDSAKKNWLNIYDGIQTYLKVGQFSNNSGQVSAQKERQQAVVNDVMNGLKSWGLDPQTMR